MKGQYLAVETVLTFGLGLVVALGTITALSDYRNDVLSTASDKQVNTIEAEIKEAVYDLKEVDSGHKTVDLSPQLGGQEYSIAFGNGIRIFSNSREYRTSLRGLNSSYDFSGSVDGGPVKIFKRENKFTIRSN